jgi:hypothetical protein
MFVPIHHLPHGPRHRGGRNPQVRARAVLAAASGAVLTAGVSNALQGASGGSGHAMVVGLGIGLGSAALGLAVARAIGRQGKL